MKNYLSHDSSVSDPQRLHTFSTASSLPALDPRFFQSRRLDSPQIRVYVRLRPPSIQTADSENINVMTLGQDGRTITLRTDLDKESSFVFDRVFAPETPTSEVFARTGEELISELLQPEGRTCVYMAYGHAQTGKSLTMGTGPTSHAPEGVVPQLVAGLFQQIKKLDSGVGVYLEFYQSHCNVIQDLFNPDNGALAIREENVRPKSEFL